MTIKSSDQLLFLPLGGAGEIGMNLNLYAFGPPNDQTWVMVDLGITFGNGEQPGIDIIMPDPTFIEERRDRLAGLVLTHAHEDHLGAVPYLWERLRCPIYATPFTISILKRKLAETEFANQVQIIQVPLSGRFNIGPFDMELITLTHSIPEPNAIAIRTPLGNVLHTGDWKFDPGPVIGKASDKEALSRLGDEGVLALVCDSTNVFTPGKSGSEGDILNSLNKLLKECQGRVVVACFATNVARLETIARAAKLNNRDVVLAGRSLWRINEAARENGYLSDTKKFIDEEDAGHIPNDKLLIICTGSQGEPRAALSRIASGDHRHINLVTGDTVIFSARSIPGNEQSISTLQNRLMRLGVRVITARDYPIHVSGHPAREELEQMYQLTRPRIAIPVHGERRHLDEHALLALKCQVPKAIVVENGSLVHLAPSEAKITDKVTSGRLALDGNRLVSVQSELVRSRIRALYNGSAVLSAVLTSKGEWVGKPQLTTIGVIDDGEDQIIEEAIDAAKHALKELTATKRDDDNTVREAMRISVRRLFRKALNKNPQTTIHLIRI
jgi:ribonuclease J